MADKPWKAEGRKAGLRRLGYIEGLSTWDLGMMGAYDHVAEVATSIEAARLGYILGLRRALNARGSRALGYTRTEKIVALMKEAQHL